MRRGDSCIYRRRWQIGAMAATVGLMVGAAPAFAQDAEP